MLGLLWLLAPAAQAVSVFIPHTQGQYILTFYLCSTAISQIERHKLILNGN
jgi:hypothetical protein